MGTRSMSMRCPSGCAAAGVGRADQEPRAVCRGHVNWVPVTYTGTIWWGGYNDRPLEDRDYDLFLDTPNRAGQTLGNRDMLSLLRTAA